MEKVIVRRKEKQCKESENPNLHPVLQRVIRQRNCQYTKYDLKDLETPADFTNIDYVAQKIFTYIKNQTPIIIVGDYDCDGATATAVAVKGLQLLGHRTVDYLIPNRFKSGYGLSPEIVDQALKRRIKPEVIITVDNGISSIEGIDYALKRNIEVIVTDHHLPGENLPKTEAIINPQLKGDQFKSKAICGVGVIFYVLLAVRKRMAENSAYAGKKQPNFIDLLDMVTIGTIADCVPLDKNNRIMIAQGLKRIRCNQISTGIRAMIRQSKVRLEEITAIDLAFKIAPKLNAAGRMDDMSIGVQCLLSDDVREAERLASQLFSFNDQRKDVQANMQKEAIEQALSAKNKNKKGVVCYHKNWHQGVIGIIASRVKDILYKPCIIFTDDESGYIKGSGRSIDGIHLRDVLAKIASKHNLLEKFGGHAMAAGLRIKKSALEKFRCAFDSEVGRHEKNLFNEVLHSDGPLSAQELSIKTALAIAEYGIWGNNYPEPLFENSMQIKSKRLIKGQHLRLELNFSGLRNINAMWFFCPEKYHTDLKEGQSYDFFYKLAINEYLGEKKLNLFIEHVSKNQADEDMPL